MHRVVGVKDGIRTRDRRDHNPELYQLSYLHHRSPREGASRIEAPPTQPTQKDTTHARGRHHGAGAAAKRQLWGPTYSLRTSCSSAPSLISRIRSVCCATPRSWVTMMNAVPSSSLISRKSL